MTALFLQVRTFKEVKKFTQNIMLSEKSQRDKYCRVSLLSGNLGGKKIKLKETENRIMVARGWQDEANGARW